MTSYRSRVPAGGYIGRSLNGENQRSQSYCTALQGAQHEALVKLIAHESLLDINSQGQTIKIRWEVGVNDQFFEFNPQLPVPDGAEWLVCVVEVLRPGIEEDSVE